MYSILKYTHIVSALISIAFFVLRGVWMLSQSPLLRVKVVKILPHIIDTIFLLSGIALTVMLQQYPFVQPWLTAKVLGLVAYIVLGTVALRRGRSKAVRAVFWVLSIALFVWIVSVARSKSAWGFLAFLN